MYSTSFIVIFKLGVGEKSGSQREGIKVPWTTQRCSDIVPKIDKCRYFLCPIMPFPITFNKYKAFKNTFTAEHLSGKEHQHKHHLTTSWEKYQKCLFGIHFYADMPVRGPTLYLNESCKNCPRAN